MGGINTLEHVLNRDEWWSILIWAGIFLVGAVIMFLLEWMIRSGGGE